MNDVKRGPCPDCPYLLWRHWGGPCICGCPERPIEFIYEGKEYVLVENPGYIQNAILSGEAILVDVGEEELMYAIPAGAG